MVTPRAAKDLVLALALLLALSAFGVAQEVRGSVRGIITDKEFDVPVGAVTVTLVESGQKTQSDDQGHYVLDKVAPGRWTLLFQKEGYARSVKADVAVLPGQLADVDVALAGEFTDLEELVVQDLPIEAAGSESDLMRLRFESPALMDSIGAELISRAGAGDAASALRLVAGATVQDGKSAVIRGLPDRYVSSQLNGVRLPSADENKRAVELDQFPASVLESVQVSKTFTPDQQGDATGGAVNVVLKSIPNEPFFIRLRSQVSMNSQVMGSDFLSYKGGGVGFMGLDDGGRAIQYGNIGGNWTGAAGVSRTDAPLDSKWSLTVGGSEKLDNGWKIGGIASLFYERDSAFYDKGRNESWWVRTPGAGMTPQFSQGTPEQGDFKTELFDITQGRQSVQNGGLFSFGAENEDHTLRFTLLTSNTTEDTATLAEDTRGKAWFFPGYDPNDPTTPGHGEVNAAPYLRLETLDYVERSTTTLQLNGEHKLHLGEFDIAGLQFGTPELDWTAALSMAGAYNPDKRQFGSLWTPAIELFPGYSLPPLHVPFKPAANFNLGNFQRIWKQIDEQSNQFAVNLKLPFSAGEGLEGSMKLGAFSDSVTRTFNQDSFSNFGDSSTSYAGNFGEFWSAAFPNENHPISASNFDVDYEGTLDVSACYAMTEYPLTQTLRAIAGFRVESTNIGIVNNAESDATWYPPSTSLQTQLNPGDADVDFSRIDVLPSIGIEWKALEAVVLRASFNRTLARQTFKELTPVLQQEYLGGPVFIGNPELETSAISNYDLRAEWAPQAGSLVSASLFHKSLTRPIEYVQRISTFNYTTAVNYPEGSLTGIELEARHDLGREWSALKGLSAGANATLLRSEVVLPADEVAQFNQINIMAPMTSRDMTNAPSHLFNVFLTWDSEETGTKAGLFYTLQGESLIAGAGVDEPNFVPSVYALSYGTLNFSLTQDLAEGVTLQFQAKNLLNPDIATVYRSPYIGGDVLKTSMTRGMDLSIALVAEFRF